MYIYQTLYVNTHPFDVLLVSFMEVDDPVPKALESGRCQGPPDGGQLAVEEGLGHLIQFCTHTHLTSQSLGQGSRMSHLEVHIFIVLIHVHDIRGYTQ